MCGGCFLFFIATYFVIVSQLYHGTVGPYTCCSHLLPGSESSDRTLYRRPDPCASKDNYPGELASFVIAPIPIKIHIVFTWLVQDGTSPVSTMVTVKTVIIHPCQDPPTVIANCRNDHTPVVLSTSSDKILKFFYSLLLARTSADQSRYTSSEVQASVLIDNTSHAGDLQ